MTKLPDCSACGASRASVMVASRDHGTVDLCYPCDDMPRDTMRANVAARQAAVQ